MTIKRTRTESGNGHDENWLEEWHAHMREDSGIAPDMNAEDEAAAWAELARTVKPLARTNDVVMPDPRGKKISVQEKRSVVALERIVERQASPLPQRQIKKLKRLQYPVEAHLDLHGHTMERAHPVLIRFVENAIRHEMRCIEIVTGRGDPKKGTGLLRRFVPLWLSEMNAKSMILHVEVNPASRGGSLLVLLRRNKGRH